MKKLVLGAILVLLIAVGGGVYFLLSNLDEIVKNAIETYGSQAASTQVQVDKVQIGLKDGSGAISGLRVANPAGFKAPLAFSLGEVSTRVDLKALSEEMVTIEEVRIVAPEVFFELNAQGQNNLEQLKNQLSGVAEGSSSTTQDSASSGPSPKIKIRHLLFADGKINAHIAPLNKDYKLALPKIELNDLGGDSGASAEELAARLLTLLNETALTEVKRQGLDQYKEQLKGEVDKRVAAEKEKLKQKLGDELGGQAGDQAEQVLKGLFDKK